VKQTHRAYKRAREKVLIARLAQPAPFRQADGEDLPPEVAAVIAAEDEMRVAEAAVADELQVAWDRNREAVAAAKTAIVDARREQARVETECGKAALRRDRRHPVLNGAERAAVAAARAWVGVVVEAHLEELARFKDGVTIDQLEAV
jgi:hypothetical protein